MSHNVFRRVYIGAYSSESLIVKLNVIMLIVELRVVYVRN